MTQTKTQNLTLEDMTKSELIQLFKQQFRSPTAQELVRVRRDRLMQEAQRESEEASRESTEALAAMKDTSDIDKWSKAHSRWQRASKRWERAQQKFIALLDEMK